MKDRQPVAILHAGAMKTGTTFLQSKLIANRDHLADQGIHFAGRVWAQQVHAVQSLLGLAQHDPVMSHRSEGAWSRFVREARESEDPTVLLSMEFLSFAKADAAARAVAELEAAGREVHLVLTVRDIARVVPALWQTSITSGGITTWERFTTVIRASTRGRGKVGAALARAGLPTARRFIEVIDIPRMIEVWTQALPPERVHVIVVPGPDAPPDRLWELFSEVVGIDTATTTEPPEQVNESLGYPSAELVRRVNEELRLSVPSDQRVVKVDLGRNSLSRLRHDERRATLDPATFRATMRWNARIADAISSSNVTLHGDLADLPTDGDPADYGVEADQRPPSDEELLTAAGVGFRRMRRRHVEMTQQHLNPQRAKKKRRRVKRQLILRRNWPDTPDPVAAAVADIATLCRSVISVERILTKRRQQRRQQQQRQHED
ncbi:hypothetical protein KUV85_14170 [Nocardioides panacisoli]|uniref:hypothetical protein n=1 Tax=Nocardioides panacisoli TaxID=627624 RepID=UPI001C639FA4|nr:hypothetical protein [Nocardioides panacisoli]QYJ03463.1 hypothetical protein KUV85_14170 [Nocardioides panacisoli]